MLYYLPDKPLGTNRLNMTLLIIYGLIALIVSFLCSISEAVLLSVRAPYIASLEKKGKRSAGLLKSLKDDLNRPLSAILTLNTISHTIGAAGVGAQAAEQFGSMYVGAASAVLTILILVFSEIIPKNLGAVYWRQLAPGVGVFVRYMIIFLTPFVLLSQALTRGISPPPTLKGFSREEFAAMADIGAQEGQLEAKESKILKNLFRFQSSTIRNIMTPRTVVFALQQEMTIEEFFRDHHQTPFSRIPIYNYDRDDITGFVLKDEILLAQARGQNDARLKDFTREIKIINGNKSLFHLFEFILDHREHIVLVLDEYGGMEGVVTLEDVIETLLGLEIVDEADKTVDMQALARVLWEQRARRMGLISDPAGQNPENLTSSRREEPEEAYGKDSHAQWEEVETEPYSGQDSGKTTDSRKDTTRKTDTDR